jgi:glycosyltransferase involved in cell wall biosynthesis
VTVGSAGRLSPRKRFPDIVRGFCGARQGAQRLYLRLLPSLVFKPAEDAEQLGLVEEEIRLGGARGYVDIDRTVAGRHDYLRYSTYVCASSYEGFSMTPIEASYCGCPALMSEIPPHRTIAAALFGEQADDFLFPVGDTDALARLLRDELTTGRRRRLLAERQSHIRATITTKWSLAATTRALASLAEKSAHD